MSLVVACSLVFGLSAIGSGSQQILPLEIQTLEFQQLEQSKNMTQLLSSNANHFWAFHRNPRILPELAPYVSDMGVISGDPHLGNVTVVPVRTKQGKEKLRFINVDFDDGGRGPFALEFLRFVTVAKASSKKIKMKELFRAYWKGLNGKEVAMPKRIAKALEIDFDKYEIQRAAYVANKMKAGHFKYKEGEIEKWDGQPNISEVAEIFKGSKVLEVAKRPMERGGSLDGLRLWVLTQDDGGVYRIKELKQFQNTALSEYSRQPEDRKRLQSLYETYWQGIDPTSYYIAEISGLPFWVREKKVEVLTYKNSVEEDEGRVYLANLMGLTQAGQPEAASYITKVGNDRDHFSEAIKKSVLAYLGIAEENFE